MSTPRFADFQRILFFTGAGLSAESGIPTYRGKGGMWNEYNYEDYACQRAFDEDPEKVWDFHDKRRAAVAACEPNEAHRIIEEVQRAQPGTAVVTQNIDGLHQRSGATDVVELHGSLWRVRCDREHVIREDTSVPMSPRRCACGAYFRPDIVWFEDSLREDTLRRAQVLLAQCDLLISVGTSGVVYPAAELPRIAMRNGATSVEINLEDTPVSALYKYQLRGTASAMLASMGSKAP
jgi:NAD-dependent protein deacetylase/lipoamidase